MDRPTLDDSLARWALTLDKFSDCTDDQAFAAVVTADGGTARLTYGDARAMLRGLLDAREQLDRIASWHSREMADSGLVGDWCNECSHKHPCETRRMADGTHEDLDAVRLAVGDSKPTQDPERSDLPVGHSKGPVPVAAVFKGKIVTESDLDALLARVRARALMDARDELAKVAERLESRDREPGWKQRLGAAACVRLACVRLIELADAAQKDAGKGLPGHPAALPDVVGTPDRVWWIHLCDPDDPARAWLSFRDAADGGRPPKCAGCGEAANNWFKAVRVDRLPEE